MAASIRRLTQQESNNLTHTDATQWLGKYVSVPANTPVYSDRYATSIRRYSQKIDRAYVDSVDFTTTPPLLSIGREKNLDSIFINSADVMVWENAQSSTPWLLVGGIAAAAGAAFLLGRRKKKATGMSGTSRKKSPAKKSKSTKRK